MTSTSGVLKDTPYTFSSRFVSEDGKEATNPEELIAAAHAGCFCMKLSFVLGNHGHTPDVLDCTSQVKLGPVDGGTGIVGIRRQKLLEGELDEVDVEVERKLGETPCLEQ